MSNTVKFDTSLPTLYNENWKEAYRSDETDSPRLSTYQAPNGKPIPFIYKSIRFSGGQSVDTAEYPFWGLWSNEALNEKPQMLNVQGFLRGAYYLQQRTALVDALRAHTSDETPGFLDLPLWGRFPIVVVDYGVEENVDEGGQCAVSLTLTRAGVPVEERAKVLEPVDFTKPEAVAAVAQKRFSTLEADTPTLLSGFRKIKEKLQAALGRVHETQIKIYATTNEINNEINGISNLIAQGISAPGELAQTFVNAAFSFVNGIIKIAETPENITEFFMQRNNKKRLLTSIF
jgi:prophage DNA circulation protein